MDMMMMESPTVATTANYGSPDIKSTIKSYGHPSLSPPPPPMKRWLLPSTTATISTAATNATAMPATPLPFHTTTNNGGILGSIRPKMNDVPYLNNGSTDYHVNDDEGRCGFFPYSLPVRVFLPRLLDFDDNDDCEDDEEGNKKNIRDLSNEDFFNGLPPTTISRRRPTNKSKSNSKWIIQRKDEQRMDIS